jgi:hypothetical protein
MAPFGAPLQFDGIAPSALPYNLLSVARIEPAADQRFENGIGYYAYPCGPAKKFDQCATVVVPKTTSTTTAATDFGGFTTNAVNGLALLEGVLQRDGVIHATRRMVTAWIAARVINDDEGDGVLRTYLGTPVVAGGGYSGAPPSGQPANAGTVEWAYVTTMPSIFRGPAFVTPDTVAEALDRSVNTLTFYAERQYVVAFDQCVRAAVRIDRNQTAA